MSYTYYMTHKSQTIFMVYNLYWKAIYKSHRSVEAVHQAHILNRFSAMFTDAADENWPVSSNKPSIPHEPKCGADGPRRHAIWPIQPWLSGGVSSLNCKRLRWWKGLWTRGVVVKVKGLLMDILIGLTYEPAQGSFRVGNGKTRLLTAIDIVNYNIENALSNVRQQNVRKNLLQALKARRVD